MTDSNWVTVFGYPLSAASFILAQLAHCGNIVATRSPTKGNWMHIKYSSKLEARRALANNGKVFAGTVMIGVIPCRDQVFLKNDEFTIILWTNNIFCEKRFRE